MIACVSVPWAVREDALFFLGGGQPVPTKEAPEVGRAYLLIPMRVGHDDVSGFLTADDVEIQYFWTPEEAVKWGERDVERRLMGEEERQQ